MTVGQASSLPIRRPVPAPAGSKTKSPGETFGLKLSGKDEDSMKRKNLFKISTFVVAVLALSAVASAQVSLLPNYTQTTTIVPPGGLPAGFDISWVDSANQRYYLADRGAKPKPGAKNTARII